MITPGPGVRIWVAADVTDMRRGFDGLAAMVQQQLGQDPLKRTWERGIYMGVDSTHPEAVKRHRPRCGCGRSAITMKASALNLKPQYRMPAALRQTLPPKLWLASILRSQ